MVRTVGGGTVGSGNNDSGCVAVAVTVGGEEAHQGIAGHHAHRRDGQSHSYRDVQDFSALYFTVFSNDRQVHVQRHDPTPILNDN